MTCGEGHNQIAKALKTELDERGVENKIVQLFGFDEKEVERQNKIFLNACKFIPHLYELVWEGQRRRNPNKKEKGYMSTVIRACKDYIQKQIQDFEPNVIICTHNNAGAVVGALKREGKLGDVATYGVVFDYCLCPYWESNTDLDYVVLPHENLIGQMTDKGFDKSQLLPFGLVVDKKFTHDMSKEEARKIMGVDPKAFAVVLYSGGNCASANFPLVKLLAKDKEVNVISICGKNKKQKKLIDDYVEKNEQKNVINIGFCTNLEVVYSACDLAFSRGGGMGLTEQINKNIPFVLREKLLINEDINKKMFCNLGMAKGMKKVSDAPKIVKELKDNPKQLDEMRENIQKFCKKNSTEKFVDFIIKEREQKI